MNIGPTPVPLVGQQAQIEQQAVAMTAQMIVSFAQQIALARIIGRSDGDEWADSPERTSRIVVESVAEAIGLAMALAKENQSIIAAAKSMAPLFRIQ